MQSINEERLGQFLRSYRVAPPEAKLLAETKRRMRKEMVLHTASESGNAGLLMVLVLLALLVCLNLFYMATLGTILKFTLPGELMVYLRHSFYGLFAAGAALVCGTAMLIFFKIFQGKKVLNRVTPDLK